MSIQFSDYFSFAFYFVPMGVIWFIYATSKMMRQRRHHTIKQETQESGLLEPASLHPVIDPKKCLGCGACITACPEGEIIGMFHGKAELIAPANCIGHGACKAACPLDAITLVFGTETRGVELPVTKPNFETDVPGVFIAGELGGMGLIRNAIEQGKQAVASVKEYVQQGHSADLDVIIVGAGPAGIASSLTAKEAELKYLTIDQDSLGGTVSHFPRNKIVMTAPVQLPLIGKVKMRETTKEALLEFWEGIFAKQALNIHFGERLDDVIYSHNAIQVITTKKTYKTRALLLCLGRRGTPRKLGVPGEKHSKVVYRLADPAQYRGQHVLVVGGGDSALEAAVSIAEEAGSTVTLSYRSGAFSRAKPKNRKKVDAAVANYGLNVMLGSNVIKIGEKHVEMDYQNKSLRIKNDAVIICAGGILPTPFLKKIGINIETKYGTE